MNWRRAAVAAGLVIPVVGFLAWSMRLDPRIIRSPLVGRQAPDFSLAALPSDKIGVASGDTIRLSDHLGEVVVLNFWASWCVSCPVEHPELMVTAEKYRDRGVHFYGILHKDSQDNARRWLDRFGEAYPTGVDENTRVSIEWGLSGVPETFFIGRDGRVAHKHFGPITREELSRQIEALLAVESPAVPGGPSADS